MVAGGCWAKKDAGRFLLDQRCERMNFPKTIEAVRAMAGKWPEAHRKLVEDKANGSAVIDTLKHEISGLIAVNPEGGKIARAHAVSAIVEAGNVFLPHPMVAPWVDGYLAELSIFPNGRHDDQVDQTTQALNRLSAGAAYGLVEFWMRARVDGSDEQRIAAGLPAKPPVVTAETPGCPRCGATTCRQPVSSGGVRCGHCGKGWDERPVQVYRPSRTTLAGHGRNPW
jgi:predicted phage terminase large subunit-like protein